MGLDDQTEQAWLAAESLGCQAAAAAGMLGLPGGATGCVGNLVAGGHILRAENDSTGERSGWHGVGWGWEGGVLICRLP